MSKYRDITLTLEQWRELKQLLDRDAKENGMLSSFAFARRIGASCGFAAVLSQRQITVLDLMTDALIRAVWRVEPESELIEELENTI